VTTTSAFAGVPARVVAPLVAAFVLFVGIVTVAVRRPSPPVERARRWRPFLTRLVSTAVGGYAAFLLIVLVFHRVIAGQRDVMGGAAASGALLAFGIAVPAFVAFSAIEAVVRRRRP
jgi:hypothetical protein